MTRPNLLLLADELNRRSRQVLKNRYKATNPKTGKNGETIDRTIGMPNGSQVKKIVSDKENILSAGELRQRCLEITRRHS